MSHTFHVVELDIQMGGSRPSNICNDIESLAEN